MTTGINQRVAQSRTFLGDLIERSRKFIEDLDANWGEINLDIFEDFYPDRAYFVYALLQKAEDAGATELTFSLLPDRLVCEHGGRAFTLEDARSIPDLHDSTKANAQDKIRQLVTVDVCLCSGGWGACAVTQ